MHEPSTFAKPAQSSEKEVLITRVFDAPCDMVFRAWSDRSQLERWFAPRGCTLEIAEFDFRVGGRYRYCVRNPHANDCWCCGTYFDIVPSQRIVYSAALCDEAGQPIDSDAAGKELDWPSETTVTITFAESAGKTTITLHQTVSEALARRTGAYPSWLDMLDRLAEDLTAGSY